jgi:hypothetical protein
LHADLERFLTAYAASSYRNHGSTKPSCCSVNSQQVKRIFKNSTYTYALLISRTDCAYIIVLEHRHRALANSGVSCTMARIKLVTCDAAHGSSPPPTPCPVTPSVSVLSDISLLSEGLGQCRQVPPNLSQRSDTIWRLLFQKKNAGHAMIFWAPFSLGWTHCCTFMVGAVQATSLHLSHLHLPHLIVHVIVANRECISAGRYRVEQR